MSRVLCFSLFFFSLLKTRLSRYSLLCFLEEPSWAQMGKRVGSDGCLISSFLCCLLLVSKLHCQRPCERETEGEWGSKRLQAQIGKVKLVTYQVIEGLRPCTQNPRYCTIHSFIRKDALLEMAMNRHFLYQ